MANPALNLRLLPNYPALLHIYQQYYQDSKNGIPSNSCHLSSHWQRYSQESRVKIGSDDTLLGIEGKGFGSYRHERFLKRFADYLCCAIHFLRAENKIEIVRLTRLARSLVRNIPFGYHYLSYDLFRQVHALATVRQYFHPHKDEHFTVLVIGDGFGFLSALIKAVYPSSCLVLIDIGRTLFFQCLYSQILYPGHVHTAAGFDEISQDRKPMSDFVYCPAEKLEEMPKRCVRLIMNVCSMQEMNKTEIERYFRYLRAHTETGGMFYCCNRESKVLPDGEVVEFDGYPWLPTDRHLIDGYPSVYRFWLGSRRNGNKPKGYEWIPFVDGPDGPIRHRLTVLTPHP